MSEGDPKKFDRHKFSANLARLRRQIDAGSVPDGLRELADDVRSAPDNVPEIEPQAMDDMFSVALHDAREGRDISKRHPAFFRQLLADRTLRDAFLLAVETLSDDQAESTEAMPASLWESAPPIGEILRQARPPQPVQDSGDGGGWRLRWERTAAQLQQLFSQPATSPVYRRQAAGGEQEPLTLINDPIQIGDLPAQLLLEIERAPETPHLFQPLLSVASLEPIALNRLQVRLRWGNYVAQTPLPESGWADLPAIPAASFLNEAEDGIKADLTLVLEPILH